MQYIKVCSSRKEGICTLVSRPVLLLSIAMLSFGFWKGEETFLTVLKSL